MTPLLVTTFGSDTTFDEYRFNDYVPDENALAGARARVFEQLLERREPLLAHVPHLPLVQPIDRIVEIGQERQPRRGDARPDDSPVGRLAGPFEQPPLLEPIVAVTV